MSQGLLQGQSALGQIAGGGSNPFLDAQFGAAARRTNQNFAENVLPGIQSTFGAGGRTGGGLHAMAVTNAARDMQQNMGDLAANMYGGAYESDASRRLAAAQSLQGAGMQGLGMGTGALGMSQGMVDRSMQMAGTAGGMDQQQAQAQLDAQQAFHNERQQIPYQQMQAAHAASGFGQANPYSYTRTKTRNDMAQTLVGGVTALAGAINPFGG
ncbi:MAG: hypothetical protein HC923_00210 [Myxococcales bacterium]|nr:hypothetical protein [Myxococcales bacterium]